MPDTIIIPNDLFEEGFEITKAMGKLDTANNNPNVHQGVYTLINWQYMDDANNWFLADGSLMKASVKWTDRVGIEFAFAEDLDTLNAKWRGYMRYALGHHEWRWALGHQVS